MMACFRKVSTQGIIREGGRDYNSSKTAGNIRMMKKRHWRNKQKQKGLYKRAGDCLLLSLGFARGQRSPRFAGRAPQLLGGQLAPEFPKIHKIRRLKYDDDR